MMGDGTNEMEMGGEVTGVRNALSTITNVAKHLTNSIDSLCADIKTKNLENGISLFTVKEKLLVFYMQYITEFMKMKVLGQKVEGCHIIERLAEIRVYLERIHPIEKKLKYQIEKMLKVAVVGATDKNDPSRFRANPASMSLETNVDDEEDEDDSGDDESKKKPGIYVPPKLSAVHYDGDESRAERRKKIIERARKRALQSSVMQELKEEYLDTPVEVKSTNSLKQMEDKYQKRKREFEEEYFTRLPVTKGEVKRAKRISTIGTLGDEVTRFEDTSILHGNASSISKKNKTNKKKFPKRGGKKKKFKR